MKDIEVLENYISKRNHVYKVKINNGTNGKLAVMKEYSMDNQKFVNTEYENMQMLQEHGMLIPDIIDRNNDSLTMEYVQGDLAADLTEKLDTGAWIDELALWMAKLHKIKKGTNSLLKTDVNLRNFIYSKGKIYGLDFEDLHYGDIRKDLANICFFILTDTPSYTKEKHIIMRRFLQSYEKHSGLELKEMSKYLLKSRAEAKIRRSQYRKDGRAVK
jgi:tRNA A-37 threonylcarbamoyl transferase component Bud32